MQQMPHRIECIDISNIQGTEPVAAIVVFEKGKPKKSFYRKYRIKTVQAPDDYASMAEVLRRRFGKGKASEPFPELLMVDGGKGSSASIFRLIDESSYGWQKINRVVAGQLLPNIEEVIITRK